MAVPTVSITGNILSPSGEAPTSGRVTARLSAPGSALDGLATVRVGAEVSANLTTGGALSIALVPNDNIVPSGTYYLVTIILVLANGRRMQWAERWSVPYTPTPIDVGSVPRLSSSPTTYYLLESTFPNAMSSVAALLNDPGLLEVEATTGGVARTLSDWTSSIDTPATDGIIERTPVTGSSLVLLQANSPTSGFEGYQSIFRDFDNPGAGAGTKNHGVWTGFNAGRHAGDVGVVAGKPSLMMGFEDNYFDSAGDLNYGMEWYVEYWSPNGTSVQMRRPFYTRILSNDNSRDGCVTVMNIGTDGLGQLTVQAGLDQLLYIDGDQTMVYKPITMLSTLEATSSISAGAVFKGGVWIDKKMFVVGDAGFGKTNAAGNVTYSTSTDRVVNGILTALPTNSNGAYVGWSSSGVPGTLAGDLLLIPRSDVGGTVRIYAGSGTPTKVVDVSSASVDLAKPLNVTGDVGVVGSITANMARGSGTITHSASDRMVMGILGALPVSQVGSYIGWANGIGGTLTGDLILVPRTDIGGAIRFFTGSGTPAKVLDLGPAAIGFFGTAAAAKPTVSGSKGGNAALASLLTALSGLGLITDSSS